MEPRLNHLLAELRRKFATAAHVSQVEEYLSSKGYDHTQIGTIVAAWLSDIGLRGPFLPADHWAVRVQGAHERGRFSTEAWGHLIGLRAAGHLGPQELELVIDRLLMHADGPVGIDDVRSALDTAYGDGTGSLGEPTIVH